MRAYPFMFIVLSIFTLFALVSGCGKSDPRFSGCTDQPVSADSAALVDFASAKGIAPLSDTVGLFYKIIDSGTGTHPTVDSTIYVTYTGTLLNGNIFDSTTNPARTGFKLGDLIPGWQIALPKIGNGGRIQLLVPSAYGYGCQGAGNSIAPNTPIFFDLTLVRMH